MEEKAILLLLLAAGAIGAIYFLIIGIRAVLQLLAIVIRIIVLVLLIVLGGMYLAQQVDKYTREPEIKVAPTPGEEGGRLARETGRDIFSH